MTEAPAARDGVGASCVGLPAGSWPRLIDFLVERFPAVSAGEWAARMARGDVLDAAGLPVGEHDAYRPHSRLFYWRSVPHEPHNPAQETIVFEDDWLVVADKPHFLPVTPSGPYLQETLLVRLRRRLALDELTPLHRIDRETAGLVMFAKRSAHRMPYHALFASQGVRKTYEAIAPHAPHLQFPLERRSLLVQAETSFMQMREADRAHAAQDRGHGAAAAGPAHTRVERLQVHGAWARYGLQPLTGRRHQLRVHMAAMGLPILGDRIYPQLQPSGTDDAANPLRLLAKSLSFIDPLSHTPRQFESRQALAFPCDGL